MTIIATKPLRTCIEGLPTYKHFREFTLSENGSKQPDLTAKSIDDISQLMLKNALANHGNNLENGGALKRIEDFFHSIALRGLVGHESPIESERWNQKTERNILDVFGKLYRGEIKTDTSYPFEGSNPFNTYLAPILKELDAVIKKDATSRCFNITPEILKNMSPELAQYAETNPNVVPVMPNDNTIRFNPEWLYPHSYSSEAERQHVYGYKAFSGRDYNLPGNQERALFVRKGLSSLV